MQNNPKKTRKDELSDSIDSKEDKEKMKDVITEVDLPDISEIPGQENIVPAPLGSLADTTISSRDEEGNEVFDENIDEDIKENPDSNVSNVEKHDLNISANDMPGDDENLREAALDDTDSDNDKLNEGSFKNDISGSDLDVPGADLDDEEEAEGEEDEENNDYSLGGDNDEIPQDEF